MRTVLLSFAILVCLLSLIQTASSTEQGKSYISMDLTMVNLSFTETESNLKRDETTDETSSTTTESGSGSSSVISLDFTYNVPLDIKKVIFVRAVSPFMPSDGSGLVYGGAGFNYFFSGMSSRLGSSNDIVKIDMFTKWKFYAGGQAGFGYLIYVTETAKKTDILFELGVQVGGIYEFKEKWGMKGEVYIGRGVGTQVSATDMQIILGTTYTL